MHRWEILVPGMPVYTNVGFLGFCNIVLVQVDGRYMVIDPGHHGNRERLLKALGERGLRPSDIDYVVLTHAHYDHALNAVLFTNAKVYVSRREYEYSMGGGDPYEEPLVLQAVRDRLVLVEEGQDLHGARFIGLPGHTAGSMGVLLDDGTLVAGDAVKYVAEAASRSVTFTYYSVDEANRSVGKALSVARVVVPGHDTPFSVDEGGGVRPLRDGWGSLEIHLRGRLNLSVIMEF